MREIRKLAFGLIWFYFLSFEFYDSVNLLLV